MIEFLHLNVNEIKESQISNLPSYRIEKANRYLFEKDKKLSLAAGILLEEGFNHLSLNSKEREVGYLEHGKPYLINRPDIHFNLSHSGDIAIAVFSKKEIGCDIEKIKNYNESIVNRCFSSEEKDFILHSENKDEAFCRIWVMKESFLKATGLGIALKMNSISFLIDKDNVTIKQNIDSRHWKIIEKRIDDYLISICEEN